MSDTNFAAMSREKLREYIKTHPQDEVAFHVYMDKLQNEPGIEITSAEQFEQLVKEKISSNGDS
jgi:hypothetical protein